MMRYSLVVTLATHIAVSVGKSAPAEFTVPNSSAVDSVNPLIGNGGDTPNGSGGMIPSTAPPFAMTRWVAQTRQNFVSVTPYNITDTTIHGFQGTHQPAIWMGESGQITVVPGVGTSIVDDWNDRGIPFKHENEVVTASYYSAQLDSAQGPILAEQSATSRVGHLRFTFPENSSPYILVEATRESILGSPASPSFGSYYPNGTVSVALPNDKAHYIEICGSNPERQDYIIAPVSTPALAWSGYFCARISTPTSAEIPEYGVIQNGTKYVNESTGAGSLLSAYVRLPLHTTTHDVRVGVSFISVAHARASIDYEVPEGTTLEQTAQQTREAWAEKLDRLDIEGADEDLRQTVYTGFYHTLQYPYEQFERDPETGKNVYYSGYDGAVHEGLSYTGYSNWDTYRAEWAWLNMMTPERIPGMVQSMIHDYEEGGWLPMWKNIIETNIMVATHADSLIAQAYLLSPTGEIEGVNSSVAWAAVYKDGTVPPINDTTVSYYDREEHVDYEVRAGLSSVYEEKGWVANDIHSESASRTLDYSYDDYAISQLAIHLNKSSEAAFFLQRSLTNPFSIFNNETGFMEARNASGSWAGPDEGWTEGDKWAYTFDVVHDVPGLIARRGGNASFVAFLDEHFDGGHNDQTNEPSHHIPYLYSLAGAASKTQQRVREIAAANYNNSVDGLSGNEDCGQMSAWLIFSVLGFYPVDPVSTQYVIGTPFLPRMTLHLPGVSQPLVITAPNAVEASYISSLRVNGESRTVPIISHSDIAQGGHLEFEMSTTPQAWASQTLVASSNETGKAVTDEASPRWAELHEEL